MVKYGGSWYSPAIRKVWCGIQASLSNIGRRVSTSPLLTKDHAKLIAQTVGVIGMWPSGIGNTDFDKFLDNTARLVELVGVDHVGLGTDMDGNFKPVFSRYLQMPNWRRGLIEKGFSDVEVSKIIGGNAQRLLTQVLS